MIVLAGADYGEIVKTSHFPRRWKRVVDLGSFLQGSRSYSFSVIVLHINLKFLSSFKERDQFQLAIQLCSHFAVGLTRNQSSFIIVQNLEILDSKTIVSIMYLNYSQSSHTQLHYQSNIAGSLRKRKRKRKEVI